MASSTAPPIASRSSGQQSLHYGRIEQLFADPATAPDAAGLTEALRPELMHYFKPAFLGRVTLVPYFPLSPEVIRQIVVLQMKRIGRRVDEAYGASFTWEPAEGHELDEADTAPHHASWAGFPWARMLGIIAITIYGSVLFYTVQIQAPVGLTELGIADPAQTGFLTSLASTGVVIGTLIFSRVGQTAVFRLLLIEFALLTTGFLLMSRAGTPMPFLVGCFINQLGAGMLLPTLLVWAMSGLPFEIRGRGAGLWTGAFSIGQFLSPVAVTTFSRGLGGLLPAFGALSAAAALGAALALLGTMRSRTARG